MYPTVPSGWYGAPLAVRLDENKGTQADSDETMSSFDAASPRRSCGISQ